MVQGTKETSGGRGNGEGPKYLEPTIIIDSESTQVEMSHSFQCCGTFLWQKRAVLVLVIIERRCYRTRNDQMKEQNRG